MPNTNRKTFGTYKEIKTGVGTSRNNPCYCGSKLKYKNCHLPQEQGFVKVEGKWEKGIDIQHPSYNLGNRIGGK